MVWMGIFRGNKPDQVTILFLYSKVLVQLPVVFTRSTTPYNNGGSTITEIEGKIYQTNGR